MFGKKKKTLRSVADIPPWREGTPWAQTPFGIIAKENREREEARKRARRFANQHPEVVDDFAQDFAATSKPSVYCADEANQPLWRLESFSGGWRRTHRGNQQQQQHHQHQCPNHPANENSFNSRPPIPSMRPTTFDNSNAESQERQAPSYCHVHDGAIPYQQPRPTPQPYYDIPYPSYPYAHPYPHHYLLRPLQPYLYRQNHPMEAGWRSYPVNEGGPEQCCHTSYGFSDYVGGGGQARPNAGSPVGSYDRVRSD